MKRALALALGALVGCGPAAAPLPDNPPVEEPPVTVPPAPDPDTPLDGDPCPEELAVFSETVHRPILVAKCAVCHAGGGVGAQSRLQIDVEPTEAGALANWRTAAPLMADDLLVLKATGRHPVAHPGGAVIAPESAEVDALEAFAAAYADEACNAPEDQGPRCPEPTPGPPVLRRLTRTEYDSTITDLFARTSTRGRGLAVDPQVGGFANHARHLVVSALLADQVRRHAEELGAIAARDLESLLPCTPTPELETECRDLFIRDFVARAYRRPVTEAELARYVTLFDATADGDFATGAQWVVTAALQSPNFLYRSELGVDQGDGTYALTPHEIASALAYGLTGAPPDEELRGLASADRLADPRVRAQQAQRLIASPAGQRHITRFFQKWLALDQVATAAKDVATYPEMDDAVRESMTKETEAFVRWALLRGGGTLTELLTAPYSFVDPTLVTFYGDAPTEAPGTDGFARVETPGRRFGLLTQGSLLSVHAKPNDASPVHRGKMVRERLMCEHLAPPPSGLVVEPPAVDPNLTTRERYAAHAEVEPCRSCHRLIDPVGFAFSHYDGIGRYRTTEAGLPIDAHGEIVGSARSNGSFDDLAGLAALLAASPDVHECFSERWGQFTYGLGRDDGLDCTLEHAHARFVDEDLSVPALLVALAESPHMAVRTSTVGHE